jgi:hypothetical protein
MEIEFSAHEDYVQLKEDYPTPIKLNIPEWFKKLKHGRKENAVQFKRTIKGCMPFLETLTTGYLLKVPTDYLIKHGVEKNEKGEELSSQETAIDAHNYNTPLFVRGHNISGATCHPIEQVEGSPLVEKNGKLPFQKILNPWTIKTPKGYSCLFLNPLNNQENDIFSIIPGIVHTDKFPQEVNFPIVINYEKYGAKEFIIKKGTPYVQVIPFKRDNWKMKIKSKTSDQSKIKFMWSLDFINRYKNKIFNSGRTSWM